MPDFNTGLSAFSDALAAKTPIPGGGAASAYVGALGAALCSMAANFTVGKAKFEKYTAELEDILKRTDNLRKRLDALVEADEKAFLPLSKAYAIPHGAPERDETLEKCLRDAANVPLQILRCACEGIKLHEELADKCSLLSVSDVGTGVVLCWAAMYGAAMSVKANTHFMKDREYAEKLEDEVAMLMAEHWKTADSVYEDIWKKL